MSGISNTILIFAEAASLAVLKAIFEKENYCVVTSLLNCDICQVIQQVNPRLVLVDLAAPVNGHISDIKRIRKNPDCTTIPLIVLEPNLPVSLKLRLKNQFSIEFMTKPFHRKDLVGRIKNFVGPVFYKTEPFPQQKSLPLFAINERACHKFNEMISDRYISSDQLIEPMSGFLEQLSKQCLTTALNESKVIHFSWKEFSEALSAQIQNAMFNHTNVTVMCFEIIDVPQLFFFANGILLTKIFREILHCIKYYLRSNDILSVDVQRHNLFIILPNTHLKIAKIIGAKIQRKVERQFVISPLQIRLASYPQDGRNAREVLAMLEVGIEKMDSDVLI